MVKNLPADQFSGVQSFSRVQLFAAPWTAACQSSLSFTISRSLLKSMSIESVMPSNYLILCDPHLLLSSIFPSIRVLSLCQVSFVFSPFMLISFGIDWFDLLAVQGTPKSILQQHNSEGSILGHSAFFMVQLFPALSTRL